MADQRTDHSKQEHDGKIHDLHHQVKNCLNTIAMGRSVLKTVQNEESRFNEIYENIGAELKKAAGLLDELLQAGCDGCQPKVE